MIRHANLHRSVIAMAHLRTAQEDEGGRELGSLRNQNERVEFVGEKQLLFENCKERYGPVKRMK